MGVGGGGGGGGGGGLAGIPYGDTYIPKQNTLVRVHGIVLVWFRVWVGTGWGLLGK